MELQYLANNKKAIPILANWYFTEWGHIEKDNTLDKVTDKLHSYLNTDKMPLIILAVQENEILGAAQLKYREMDIYPEKEHWLGGVYVSKEHRGNKIAEHIIHKVISIASNLGVHKLYLQTENLGGGLYSRLGWRPIEQVRYRDLEVLVMDNKISV